MEGIKPVILEIEMVDNGYIVREDCRGRDQRCIATIQKTKVFESLGSLKGYLDEDFNIEKQDD